MPRRRVLDYRLIAATMVAATLGVLLVASASGPLARDYYRLPEWDFAWRQGIAVVLGVAAMLAATFAPLERLTSLRVAVPLLLLTWIALAAAYFQPEVANTHRWLRLPIGSVQPSAFAKVALPLALAAWLAWCRRERLRPAVSFGVALAAVALTVGLVLFEPDLGSAMLLAAAAVAILWLAEVPAKPLLATGLVAASGFAAAVALAPYRLERVKAFFGAGSFQVQQSLIALGSGGLLGRGPGKSVQKLFFLPQPHSDFLFAIAGEELGFLGATGIMLLLGVIVVAGLRAARRAPTLAAALLAAGLTTTLAVQALLNLSVCLNLLPAKGLPLPLMSAGGSDVLLTMVAIGVLLNIGKEGA
ncbi:MAG: FtsW/RodA/SpoVE family cell cycle protein [Acidobacteriota bacterium]|jgi:cell division protein FtsW